MSKPTRKDNNQATSHSASSDTSKVNCSAPAQTPASHARQSSQATPRHPSPRFAEQPSFAEQSRHASNCQQTDRPAHSSLPSFHHSGSDMPPSDTWAAWNAAYEHQGHPGNRNNFPTSAQHFSTNHSVDSQVQQLLASTVHNLGKGNTPPYDFPFKYIMRGPEKVKACINSVTLPEHLWGIFRMIHDPKTTHDIKPCLILHIEQIVEDAREYDWETGVRRWSEEVFSRISEGRLYKGWHSTDEIQRMRMILAQSKPLVPTPSRSYTTTQNHDNFNRRNAAQSQSQPEILKGGPPCPDYNSTSGCTLRSGHIKDGKRLIHVCAFCLHNTSATNTHPEPFCRNKIRLTGGQHHFQ